MRTVQAVFVALSWDACGSMRLFNNNSKAIPPSTIVDWNRWKRGNRSPKASLKMISARIGFQLTSCQGTPRPRLEIIVERFDPLHASLVLPSYSWTVRKAASLLDKAISISLTRSGLQQHVDRLPESRFDGKNLAMTAQPSGSPLASSYTDTKECDYFQNTMKHYASYFAQEIV